MIDFMLKDPRQIIVGFDGAVFAVQIGITHLNGTGTRHALFIDAGNAQATFLIGPVFFLVDDAHHGVDHHEVAQHP